MTPQPGVVEVWRADLGALGDAFEPWLTAAERERAARFRSRPARERWARSRGVLRELLGGYLGGHPGTIELSPGPNGKPAISGSEALQFNLSHSGSLAVYAFTIGNPVGIDVELHDREVRDALGTAARVLGEEEAERLSALPPERRDAAFLRSWVRHEAALKCRGERLASPVEPGGLCLLDLEVGSGIVAALALEDEPREVRVRDVEPTREAR